MKTHLHLHGSRCGFSLIEILVVLAILMILATLVAPPIGGLLRSQSLSRQGQLLGDEMAFARQAAVTRNRDVEFRIYNAGDSWGWQSWQLSPDGSSDVPITRRTTFPETLAVSTNLSPLLGQMPVSDSNNDAGRSLRFQANGEIAASLNNSNNYLTLQLKNDVSNPPVNYYTLQINPITGRVAAYRP